MTSLVDRFGRVHTDLRISVTDRCNFRCSYCMPSEGMEWLDRSELLTFEEIERLARVLVNEAGVRSIRLTGGEPTLRARLPVLVEKLASLDVELSMTTNGTTLPAIADHLVSAGLKRVNISIDSLNRERFAELTKRDELPKVLEGIDAALASGLDPVKLNVVLMAGVNEHEVEDFLDFGREKGVIVRFIEFMPLDAQGEWSNAQVVTYDQIVARAAERYAFTPVADRGSAPAERFVYDDGQGSFGVIPSVTHAFCGSCDRMRLTAEGQLSNCLFALGHVDLRSLLRGGVTDAELVAAVAGEVDRKWEGHAIGQVHFIRPSKSMSQIGG